MNDVLLQPKATAREWAGLAVLALACLLYVMDLSVLHLAIPKLTADLKPSSVELLWIIDIYGFLVAGSLTTMGTLGDRIGRRKLLLIGAICFGAASIIAAFSTSPAMLIASRAVLGVAGATIAPSTLSLIRNMFHDPGQRSTAIGIWITSFSLGAAVGPLLGGVVLEFFWWGSVFLLAVPVMLLLLILGPRVLPEYHDADAGMPDLLSAALSVVAVLAIIYGLKQTAQDGLGWLPSLSVLAGLGVGAIFVRRQLKLDDPLIDLQLFRVPSFGAALVTYALSAFVVFGGFLYLPQYLQFVRGLSPLEAGIWTLPWALAFVVGSNVTPRLARRFRPMQLMVIGLGMAAAGVAVFTRIDASTGFLTFALASVIFALGLSPVFTLTTDLIIGSAPPERAGAASGMAETGAEFGGALGIAIFGTIGTALYRGAMAAAVPLDVPQQAADAARDTLGGAVALAEHLPPQLAMDVMDLARGAFLQGLHVASGVSTVGCIAMALFVAVALRYAQLGSEEASGDAQGVGRDMVEVG